MKNNYAIEIRLSIINTKEEKIKPTQKTNNYCDWKINSLPTAATHIPMFVFYLETEIVGQKCKCVFSITNILQHKQIVALTVYNNYNPFRMSTAVHVMCVCACKDYYYSASFKFIINT